MAADSISIWMSTSIAEVYMAGKSCLILRPVPIEHEYDPVIYKGGQYRHHLRGISPPAWRRKTRSFPSPKR